MDAKKSPKIISVWREFFFLGTTFFAYRMPWSGEKMNKIFFDFFWGSFFGFRGHFWVIFGPFLARKSKKCPPKKNQNFFYSISRLIMAWSYIYGKKSWRTLDFFHFFHFQTKSGKFFSYRGPLGPGWAGGSRGAGPPFAALRAAEKVWAFFGFQWSKTALSELQIPGFWPNLDPKNPKKNHFHPTFFFQTSYKPYLA